jgi:NADH-quinone oxidoreductase subunit K
MITIHHYLILSALLFCLGLVGLVVRKNLLIMFMCLEVLLNAVNLTLIALARYFRVMDGQVVAFFVMAVAAVEAAIGLGILINVFRTRQSVKTTDLTALQG